MTPEAEAAIRKRDAQDYERLGRGAFWHQSHIDRRALLAELDAARAENADLRLAFRVLSRLVSEEYNGSLVDIASTWGSATDEELAALGAITEATP